MCYLSLDALKAIGRKEFVLCKKAELGPVDIFQMTKPFFQLVMCFKKPQLSTSTADLNYSPNPGQTSVKPQDKDLFTLVFYCLVIMFSF